MAWLEEVKAGGGTAFTHPGMEDMLVRTSYKNDLDFLGFSQALNWNGFFCSNPHGDLLPFGSAWLQVTGRITLPSTEDAQSYRAQNGSWTSVSEISFRKYACTMAYQKLKTNKHSFFPFFQGFTLLTSGTNILVLIREIWHRYLPIRSQPTSIKKWFVDI